MLIRLHYSHSGSCYIWFLQKVLWSTRGALYGKYDLLNELPYKFETGTQNHEGIAGVLGVLEYFEWLGSEFGSEQAQSRAPEVHRDYSGRSDPDWRSRVEGERRRSEEASFSGRRLLYKQAMSAIREYEFELSRDLIGVLESVPGVRVYGVTDKNRLDERVPTVSFRLEGKNPAAIADAIGKQSVYVWNGHNYALAIVERMGLLEAGGMIRVGPVHYNTINEIETFGEVLKKAAK